MGACELPRFRSFGTKDFWREKMWVSKVRARQWFRQMLLLAAIMLTAGGVFVLPARAEEERRVVRVAYPIQEGLTEVNDQGVFSGYTYEYLQELAQYAGWTYEFVQVEGTEDEQILALMEMVQRGEVDLMGATLYSQEFAQTYVYASHGYGEVQTALKVLADTEQTEKLDVSVAQTFRIAVRSTTGSQVTALEEYCSMTRTTPVLVECVDEEDMVQALRDGRADMLLDSSMNKSDELSTMVTFFPRQFYFITGLNTDPSIMEELNGAMSRLNHVDPHFQSNLYNKYFANQTYTFSLTAEERAYTEQNHNLQVGVVEYPPFQYRDEESGVFKGISIGLLDRITEMTGLQFQYVEADSMVALYEMAASGEIDIVASMSRDYNVAEHYGLSMTHAYATMPRIMMHNENIDGTNVAGKRLAISREVIYQGYFVGAPTYYDTPVDCVWAVKNKEADYTYINAYTAQYFTNLPEFNRLKMVPQTYANYQTCFGLAASANHTLFNLLNKVLLSISSEEMQEIIYENTLLSQRLDIGDVIRQNPLASLSICVAIFGVIVALLLIILRQHTQAAKTAALELQKHMRLYAASNDVIFEYDYKKDLLMVNLPEKENDQRRVLHYDLKIPLGSEKEQKSLDTVRRMLLEHRDRVFETQLLGNDGQWHWFRVVMEIIKGDNDKPFYAIARLNNIDNERKEREQLLDKAQKDSLTQLYNSESCRIMTDRLLQTMDEDDIGAFLMLDVDNFKAINDGYGHMKGDEVLLQVAEALKSNFRSQDIIARPGGDEFMAFIARINSVEILENRCRALLEAAKQIEFHPGMKLSVSIGVALAHRGQSYEELYQMADQALYQAKAAGKSSFYIARATERKINA